jgi:hypothetical protein
LAFFDATPGIACAKVSEVDVDAIPTLGEDDGGNDDTPTFDVIVVELVASYGNGVGGNVDGADSLLIFILSLPFLAFSFLPCLLPTFDGTVIPTVVVVLTDGTIFDSATATRGCELLDMLPFVANAAGVFEDEDEHTEGDIATCDAAVSVAFDVAIDDEATIVGIDVTWAARDADEGVPWLAFVAGAVVTVVAVAASRASFSAFLRRFFSVGVSFFS